MTTTSTNVNNKLTKIAGITYSLIIILALIPTAIFDVSALLRGENAAENFVGHEGTFRLGIAIEFVMFMLVMVLSWALYAILKPVNKNLALFALIFRFGEAVLGCVVILLYLTILMLLSGAEYLQVFQPEQLQALARFFLHLSGDGFDILLVVMGVGGVAYCYLFYTSRYIPRAFGIWGMFTYATMVAYGMINIAVHNAPPELAYAMAPGALFEFTIGIWLYFKGISVSTENKEAATEANQLAVN